MEQEYMENIVQFLEDVEWIYDFHVTKIFTRDVFAQMPDDWKACLVNLPVDILNGIPQYRTQDDWPDSLKSFLRKCEELSLQNRLKFPNSETTEIPHKYVRGLSEKKKHEVLCLFKLVERLALRTGSSHVLDIGSGLGYIDSLLHCLLKLSVVGADREEKSVKKAVERQTELSDECNGIRHVQWSLADDETTVERAQRELSQMESINTACTCRSQQGKCSSNSALKNATEDQLDAYSLDKGYSAAEFSAMLIGLHACADLSPIMMKMFESCIQFSSLILLSCCYHKLNPKREDQTFTGEESGASMLQTNFSDELPSPTDDNLERICNFVNFPMSKTLKTILSDRRLTISTFGLRLAAQESGIRWMAQTEKKHETHRNCVAFRAILEAYCEREQLTLKKLRRRCARKDSFQSFDDYVNCVTENYEYIPLITNVKTQERQGKENEQNVLATEEKRDNAKKIMKECYDKYEYLFHFIEPLTGLQLALQPVMEALILVDRMAYLKEAGFRDVWLEKVFNVEISPRNVALLAVR